MFFVMGGFYASIPAMPHERVALQESVDHGLVERHDAEYLELHPDDVQVREPTTTPERAAGMATVAAFIAGAAVLMVLLVSEIGVLAIVAALFLVLLGTHAGRMVASALGRRRLRAHGRMPTMSRRRGIVS